MWIDCSWPFRVPSVRFKQIGVRESPCSQTGIWSVRKSKAKNWAATYLGLLDICLGLTHEAFSRVTYFLFFHW